MSGQFLRGSYREMIKMVTEKVGFYHGRLWCASHKTYNILIIW